MCESTKTERVNARWQYSSETIYIGSSPSVRIYLFMSDYPD